MKIKYDISEACSKRVAHAVKLSLTNDDQPTRRVIDHTLAALREENVYRAGRAMIELIERRWSVSEDPRVQWFVAQIAGEALRECYDRRSNDAALRNALKTIMEDD